MFDANVAARDVPAASGGRSHVFRVKVSSHDGRESPSAGPAPETVAMATRRESSKDPQHSSTSSLTFRRRILIRTKLIG